MAPLIKTGECFVCGKDLGVLGKVKLADGMMCGACAGKMSPFIRGRKKMTMAEVEKHLAYRKENEDVVAKFNPNVTLGNETKVYVESATGRFAVSDESNWRAENPDVITREMLNAVDIEVEEDQEEVMKELADGTTESYNPKQYKYEYTFTAHIHVSHPWFAEIEFEVSDPDARPAAVTDADYIKCAALGQEIQHALLPDKYPAPEVGSTGTTTATPAAGEGEEWTCECGQVNNSNFCSACGKPKPVRWFCPDCGVENHGAFCTNCGRKKPV